MILDILFRDSACFMNFRPVKKSLILNTGMANMKTSYQIHQRYMKILIQMTFLIFNHYKDNKFQLVVNQSMKYNNNTYV